MISGKRRRQCTILRRSELGCLWLHECGQTEGVPLARQRLVDSPLGILQISPHHPAKS
ncbi:uncharacterized protein BDZ99DRAFT_570417 [Mytilinidion resinicola]|uniref:Uncharacterized protein n=1 Tax=Mytilinidion resinicola TaxID=574789 RepID=A0A6A6YT74_9PEZI|nr:uncharacterized protein BDZ99DRAFT_570417 [Mytilinidion resinicola]KAF2811165.1 hypothetical protein BDZ99DRAFT_570417 [Mytilinidion resinicola]